MTTVEALKPGEIDTDMLTHLNRLLNELSTSASPITRSSLEAVLRRDDQTLLVARRDGRIAGMLTLVIVRILTGVRGHVEDVAVAPEARGSGVGTALVAAGQELAAKSGVRTLDLTSRPEREAAHRLYASAGFSVRKTSVYRWIPDS